MLTGTTVSTLVLVIMNFAWFKFHAPEEGVGLMVDSPPPDNTLRFPGDRCRLPPTLRLSAGSLHRFFEMSKGTLNPKP